MEQKILSPTEEALVGIERHWLTNLQIALAQFNAAPEDRAALERSIRQLDELFLLVVVGEFNAGKSAFINALLGQALLEEGVTPTTTRIHLLKHGNHFERVAIEDSVDIYTAPSDWLGEINIVDTPGTNAIYRGHEALTQEFVPRSDMVLFVTSVDRPFTESERAFLERIRDWGKKVVIVLNKIDILENAADIARIEDFIAENALLLLGFKPEIFPISARLALRAKQTQDHALLAKSGIEALEQYIISTLDEKERIRLKLRNPIGVAQHLIDKYMAMVDNRLHLLDEDFGVLTDIEREMAMYREDMYRQFRYRLADVDNVLYEFENRGMIYFDETMRILRLFDLMNKAKLQEEFARKVVGDAPQMIEQRVNEIIDWLVSSNLGQWQAVQEHVLGRRDKYAEHIVGQVGGTFIYDRANLLDTVGRVTQQALQSYDKMEEATRIAETVQQAVASTALVEVSAVGLGAVVTTIATTTAADLTGILAAGAVAVLGLLVIPAKKRAVKNELHAKIAAVRTQLMETLNTQFNRELERALREIENAISPYTRFVRAERKNLLGTREELTTIKKWLERQAAEIDAL
ncbi:MAG TPA: dynamin family protein [Anaerolineae bacterium]|mgnify:CR=1 FL=1|nr:dynamin family protein [Anaerolineae bacterium]HQK14002.1 dynamin family protein [Anaerolineae bacterium]